MPRGSAKAELLRGAKPRAASAIAASISTVSTRSTVMLCSSACMVRPVPMPITAALFALGLERKRQRALSTMVISSEPRVPSRFMLIEPSDLPLVRMLSVSP